MTERSAFGKWLLKELDTRRWSMRELARRTDVSESTISRIVSGKRNPSSALCRRIAEALRVPPERVFREAGLLPDYADESPRTREALYLFRKLPEDERRRILLIMRTLLEEQEHIRVASS
jgi:transcriptional regulator with XRE-family HTH domain